MPTFPPKKLVAQYDDDDDAHFECGFGNSDMWCIYAGNTFRVYRA